MAIGTPYKQARVAEAWDVVVIGSGIGGLTAAVLLARHGRRVLVVERHYEAGGFTHTFERPGYGWDVGVHYIGQMGDPGSPVRRAFDSVTAGKVTWQAMPQVYDRVIIQGQRFDFVAGKEAFRENLLRSFPAEGAAIGAYLRAVHAANRWSGMYFAEKAVPGPVASVLGGAMRAPYLRWAGRTTRQVLEGITGNRELIGVLTAQWGDYGLPPAQSSFGVHATIVEHYMEGGFFPVGGAKSIAEAMVPLIEGAGGCLLTSAEAAEIAVEQGRATGIRMKDGRQFRAPLVISDAGAVNTYERLLGADVEGLDALRGDLRRLAPSTAHVNLYLGLSKTDEALGTSGTNHWIYPSFDHDENVERFARNPEGPLPGVYISFPSAKDPEFQQRHPGHSTVEAISLIPWAPFAKWAETRWKKRGEEYDALKRSLEAILREAVEKHFPALASQIAYAELSTPVTTRHFMNYGDGEIYGVAASPARYQTRRLGARTPIRGLFLTGQDVASLGVVGALFGGVISASAALGKNLVSAVTR